jgi:hypothetical protein
VDRYKHGVFGIADRCADAAKSHDIEQKHFKGKHTTLTIPSMFLAASASLTAGFGATRANSSLSIASAVRSRVRVHAERYQSS